MSNHSSYCQNCGQPLAFDREDKFWFCPEACTSNEGTGSDWRQQYESEIAHLEESSHGE